MTVDRARRDPARAALGIGQGDVSKIEGRELRCLATLSRHTEATSGHLRIVAVYDETEVDLAIGDLTGDA